MQDYGSQKTLCDMIIQPSGFWRYHWISSYSLRFPQIPTNSFRFFYNSSDNFFRFPLTLAHSCLLLQIFNSFLACLLMSWFHSKSVQRGIINGVHNPGAVTYVRDRPTKGHIMPTPFALFHVTMATYTMTNYYLGAPMLRIFYIL